MKQGLFALVILAAILAAAPDAAADHCQKCYEGWRCIPATSYGRQYCDDSGGSCVFSGGYCDTTPHPFVDTDEPLAASFVVASVERLDEPPQPATEIRIASLETMPQTARR
jgi:hypothetical protein